MFTTKQQTVLYCKFLEDLNLNNLQLLNLFVDQNIFFSDPFHQTRGISEYFTSLNTMFLKFNNINFKTDNIMCSTAEDSNVSSFSWTLKMRHNKTNKSIRISGMSLVEITQQGLVVRHEDYWDPSANIYRIIPFLGFTINFVRRKIAFNSK